MVMATSADEGSRSSDPRERNLPHTLPACVSDSAKRSEKRMHFVREKRDKPAAGASMREKD